MAIMHIVWSIIVGFVVGLIARALIPGVDGVGRRADGTLVYFLLPETTFGSMAERTVVDIRRSIPLAAEADAVRLAAAVNPGMSSWVALKKRIRFEPGQSVFVLGGTGSAGQLAIQIAKHLGAGSVIAAGRGADRLAALEALGLKLNMDYAGVDFALLPDGTAFVFEANATMLVHRERPGGPLAHKNPYVRQIADAFERLLQKSG